MNTPNPQTVTVEKVTGSIYRLLNQVTTLVATLEDGIVSRDQAIADLQKQLQFPTVEAVPEVK